MIKVYNILSEDKIVAEIRTDGKAYEVFNDRTNGELERLGNSKFPALQQAISESSYLKMVPKRDGLPGILRYLLDSGDVIEATTDGVTALLNGNLLSEADKNKYMQAIMTGGVTVTNRQEIAKPTALTPERAPEPPAQQYPTDLVAKMNRWSEASKASKSKDEGSVFHDPEIEGRDTSHLEWPAQATNIGYYLKYGKFKNDVSED